MTDAEGDIIEILKRDHRSLLDETAFLEQTVSGSGGFSSTEIRMKISGALERLYRLMKAHGDLETNRFFPRLRAASAEDTDWQLGMTEMQDGMIIKEVKRLRELMSHEAAEVPRREMVETTSSLIRWIREHVQFEEEKLFPRFPQSS